MHQKLHCRNRKGIAFQLANNYLVFQGVILTVLYNGSIALRCSNHWFLATLPVIAATLNLAALVSIGSKYNQIVIQKVRLGLSAKELQVKLPILEKQENQQQQLPSRNLRRTSSGGSLDAANATQGSDDNGIQAQEQDFVDKFDILKCRIYFSVCISTASPSQISRR